MMMTEACAPRFPWRIWGAAATFCVTMVGAGVVANLCGIRGNGKLPLMAPGVMALGWLGWEALRLARTGSDSRPAIVRYVQRIIPLTFAYVVAIIATINIQRAWQPSGVLAVLVALLPALPLVGFIWVMGRLLVEEADEYQRLIQTRRILIATGFMLVVTTVWGFLEGSGLVPHAPAYAAFILWNIGLLIAPLFPGGRA
jgi:hypothetical protein